MFGGMFWARYQDRKLWNKGYCPRCFGRWEYFDMDSQGGRGYKCEGNHTAWISWGVDNVR